MSAVEVVLERVQRPARPDEPAKWSAALHGETLVTRARDPEHSACRALLAKGIAGRVTFIHKAAGKAGLSMDIEKGAGRSVIEAMNNGRPRIGKWKPFSLDAVSSPASETASSGALVPEEA